MHRGMVDVTRIYLDTCSLQRPFDDRSQPRVAIEAEAMLAILALCEQRALILVSSDIISFELNQHPHPQRKLLLGALLAHAQETIAVTDTITQRATVFEHHGIKAIDALHLAAAEAAQVDFFCTCDDRFYRRAKTVPSLTVPVVMPLELAQEVLP